ncbi:MAG TPA: sugar phosphate isomerase/epimerase [Vicinamibacterales bacterium]|nr:sugar phosphate isomerase/epimerase [Vicinamibacterales bacterium]
MTSAHFPAAGTLPRRTTMGLTSDSFQSVRFASPQRLLAVDRLMEIAAMVGAAGAHGGMTEIDFEWARRTRAMKERLDMYVEIQTFLPRANEDISVFEHAVRVAKEAGASSLRVVCLLGRRYEMFSTLADWKDAIAGFHRQIAAAVPIVEKHKMPLGIENHKDWRVDQQVALLKQYESEFLGVTLDTGNNIAVLDDPMATVELLAPYTVNTHFKDIAIEEYEEGFLLSEVPLGDGMLDLPAMVATMRRARPEVRFSLEMITRDPLAVPCLTDKYWSTFEINGIALARTLARVRANKPRAPLPRITGLTAAERAALERTLVDRSIDYARDHLGLR